MIRREIGGGETYLRGSGFYMRINIFEVFGGGGKGKIYVNRRLAALRNHE